MQLSIIIVNYNTKELLKKCLESILASMSQRVNESTSQWEVIIVDNGSEENIKSQISNIKKKYQKLKIKLIENEENVGFGRANNQAVRKAQGQFILLLNPDTIVTPKTISYMADFMEKHQKVGVATCRLELPDGRIDDACHRGFPTPWNAFCHFSGLGRLFPQSLFFNGYHLGYREMDKVHEIDACAGAFMMIRRKAGEEIGWFDEDYFWYGEDLDFCYRVKKKRWRIMYIPKVKITHYKGVASGIKEHSQGISTADEETKKRAQKARFEAMRIFYEKHYREKYPIFIRWLVMGGINILSKVEPPQRFNLMICV